MKIIYALKRAKQAISTRSLAAPARRPAWAPASIAGEREMPGPLALSIKFFSPRLF